MHPKASPTPSGSGAFWLMSCYSIPLALLRATSYQQFVQHLLTRRNWILISIHFEEAAAGREQDKPGDR